MRRSRFVPAAVILALAALVGVGLWQTSRERARRWVAVVRQPDRVMGTTCTLAAVVADGEQARGEKVLREAEGALRAVEARMSVWLADSEVSRLNAAAAGEEIPLSPDTLAVLCAARNAATDTAGAFDITVGPLIELWKAAGQTDLAPARRELEAARASSSWQLIELTDTGAVKRSPGARVDLGGIAKGYAVDQAIAMLESADVRGGLVEVGGDLRCFGRRPDGESWPVDIKDPFAQGNLGAIRLREGAACTSGNYARFVVIDGKRYSHILDPRSGRPAEAVPSAVVVAPTAMGADIWATALSVLGQDGLDRLPQGVEALVILGSEEDRQFICTPGLRPLLLVAESSQVEVWGERRGQGAAR